MGLMTYFCFICSAVSCPFLAYFAYLCGSGSWMVELDAESKAAAAGPALMASALYAATFVYCYGTLKKQSSVSAAENQ